MFSQLSRQHAIRLTALATLALLSSAAQAQLNPGYTVLGKDPISNADIFTHLDIGVAYETGSVGSPGSWDLHIHLDPAPAGFDDEYAPEDALIYVGDGARVTTPAALAFLGVNSGDEIFLIPQGNPQSNANPADDNISWVGIGAEENAPGDFSGGIQLFLRNLEFTPVVGGSTIGNFAVWQPGSLGGISVLWQSNNGFDNTDLINVSVGAHDHYNFGFSSAGIYEVTIEAIGTPTDGGPSTSGLVTYTFGVGTTLLQAAAPEPGTFALLGLGLVGAVVARRRKQVG
ncbi:MAG: choice-of-anchor M domain-containing protein [Capsulimonadales bacterium]|nr:choice-of-anchor M domain-containing protein [Capsulimonadales bacterium]